MRRITPTLTTKNRGAFTPAVVQKAAPTAVKWQHSTYNNGLKTGSIYTRRCVKGGTNSSKNGSIEPTPTSEIRAAFTLTFL